MNEQPTSYRSILQYLADMENLCRRFHRPDLEREYHDAWEFAALAIYGDLPPRPNSTPHPAYTHEPRNANTVTRRQMWESPLRRVQFRVDDHDVLECGHKFFAPGQSTARRRRCSECREVQGKLPVRTTAVPLARQQAAATIAGSRKPSRPVVALQEVQHA